jgi:ubiquinone/menaquinone biosynthesis C-methylase UbiE
MQQVNPLKNFRFKEFTNLDNSPDADYLIASMDVMSSLDSIQAIKKRAIKAMNLKSGDIVLEIGCGHGEDAEAIGEIVEDNGSVVAIDSSQRMIDEAKHRSKQANVYYLVQDANHLNYPDWYFSACHADRLLVSHENYQELFKTIIPFIKPGGVMCFTDVDALSIILSPYNKATRAILDQVHQSFVNSYMGRELPALFIQQGLRDVTVIPEISMVRSFEIMNKIFDFTKIAGEAIRAGKLTQGEFKQWEDSMRTADKEGKFLYCITFFTVLGRVPY